MGAYVNPTEKTKEEWLAENGLRCPMPVAFEKVAPGSLPVILVDNGLFTAAGICFDRDELDAFQRPNDDRPKIAFVCEVAKLHEVSPELKRFLRSDAKDLMP